MAARVRWAAVALTSLGGGGAAAGAAGTGAATATRTMPGIRNRRGARGMAMGRYVAAVGGWVQRPRSGRGIADGSGARAGSGQGAGRRGRRGGFPGERGGAGGGGGQPVQAA